MAWVTRPATGMPNSHSDAMGVDPTRPGEEGMSYLERSPIRSVHTRTTAGATRRDGVGEVSVLQSGKLARSGKGPWRLTNTRQVKAAMSVKWFQQQGLISLVHKYEALRH